MANKNKIKKNFSLNSKKLFSKKANSLISLVIVLVLALLLLFIAYKVFLEPTSNTGSDIKKTGNTMACSAGSSLFECKSDCGSSKHLESFDKCCTGQIACEKKI